MKNNSLTKMKCPFIKGFPVFWTVMHIAGVAKGNTFILIDCEEFF